MIDIDAAFSEHLAVAGEARALAPRIAEIGAAMHACLKSGGKILWMGNGGSAAQSQHFAAEFVGRFGREAPGLASIALTSDTSALTALANDHGFGEVFSRQIEALCGPDDLVVGLSTSGESANVVNGMRRARALGAVTVALTGGRGGAVADHADHAVTVPSDVVERIQEVHAIIGHILHAWVEEALRKESAGAAD